jgi:hypothetical protein
MRSTHLKFRFLCAFTVLILATTQMWAQLDKGGIAGVVLDKSGAAVAGASVRVTNTGTQQNWEATTGSAGQYSVPGLPVGVYSVEISHSGFKNGRVSNVLIHTGEIPRADVTLDVGGSTETVTVTAETEVVNTTTSNLGGTINSTSVTNLPLNGRDFTSLIALVPGSVTTGQFGQNSLGGFETGLAGVNVLLDGTDATRIDVNATSTQLGRQESRISRASIDSIQEFTVLSGTYSAQYGRSAGDIVNVVTKSGTNELHGSAYDFFRNDKLDAKNYFSVKRDPLHLNQPGGNLSGPIIKDKLFFFVNYEGVRQSLSTPVQEVVIADSERSKFVSSMQPVVNAIPHPNVAGPVTFADGTVRNDLGYLDGSLRNTLREDTGSVKVDWVASARDTVSFRYNINDSDTQTQYGLMMGQTSPSTSRNHLFKTSWTRALSATIINEASVALNRPQTDSLGGGGNFPIFQYSAFWGCYGNPDPRCNNEKSFGAAPGPALFSNRRPQHSLEYMDTLSWVKGRSTMHFGLDIRHNVTHDALDPQDFLSYASISDFENNAGIQLDTLGHTMVGVNNTNYGFFFQDDIRLTRRFTVNIGLRYEYNSVLHGDDIGNFDIATLSLMPKGGQLYKPWRKDFAPRLGFSWDPFGTGKTVIRAGGGLFFSPQLTGAALSLAGNYQQSFSVNVIDLLFGLRTCTPNLNIAYPVPSALPTCNPPLPASVNALDQKLPDSYSEHWSFGVQQQLAKDTVLELTYVGNHGVKLPAGAAYAGEELNYSPFGGKQLSDNYGNIRRLGDFLGSNYNAFQASLRRHLGRGLNVDANYTWSHELDDAVNILTGAYQNSHNPKADYGNGDIDVRHNFTLGVVYDVPNFAHASKRLGEGWQVSSILQTRSGMPFNVALSAPFLGIDQLRPDFYTGTGKILGTYNGKSFVAPASGQYGDVPRNWATGPKFTQLDLGLSKTTAVTERVSVQLRGEMFDLLNHANFANPSGNLDDPHFGISQSTIGNHVGTGTARQAQLALKVIF